MKYLVLLAAISLSLPATASSIPEFQHRLPMDVVFKGGDKFHRLVKQAHRENWAALPLGERTARVGRALLGTPYVNYTLEIHDHIESPSVNFQGLDCWTFYETSLAFARMLRIKNGNYQPEDLLALLELERYRNGRCDGTFLSRIHFLEEVFADNQARGLSINPTRELGGEPLHRQIHEMTSAWKSYRYLRNNPSLLPDMARIQDKVSALPVYHIPKERVASMEKFIQTGDIIAITSRDTSAYTSHVGIAVRQGDTARLMHATSRRDKGRKVILDSRISDYLKRSDDHFGIVIYRPLDILHGLKQVVTAR
ncbi:MAG: N-acetylmuramoyl-L-alanine amidase-like domain-containing protein [bacterium]